MSEVISGVGQAESTGIVTKSLRRVDLDHDMRPGGLVRHNLGRHLDHARIVDDNAEPAMGTKP